ncbi:MAG TPA: hypothetical protein VIF09_17225 [Polyangiaceae bacterium]
MNAPASPNPYVPPVAAIAQASDEAPGPAARCGPRVLVWSLVLGVAYGVVAGVATTVQLDFGLRRYGGLEYTPRVVGLSSVRGWGPWGAALVPAVTAVVVLHRAGKRSVSPVAIDPRLPLFAGAAVPLVYALVVPTGCLAALVVWCADSGDTSHTFVAAMTETLIRTDLAFAAIATIVNALVVAVGLRLVGPRLASRRGWLVAKLFVVWAGLQAVAYSVGTLGRWIG